MKYDVVTIGSATQDVFLIQKDVSIISSKKFATGRAECFALGAKVELDSVIFDTGGGATNAAVTLRRAGLKTAVFSRVGHDPAGHAVTHALKCEKVDTKMLWHDPTHGTAYSSVLLTPEGERTVLVYRGAASHFDWEEFPQKTCSTKWVYVTSLGGNKEFFTNLVQWSKVHGVKIFWNPGMSELEWGWEAIEEFGRDVEVLDLNREEAAHLSGKLYDNIQGIYHALHRSQYPMIVVTDGKHGGFCWMGDGRRYEVESTGHVPINTTGAGDAFGSAFLAGLMKWGGDVEMALRLAAFNSGHVVTQMGPKHGIMKKLPALAVLKKINIRQ